METILKNTEGKIDLIPIWESACRKKEYKRSKYCTWRITDSVIQISETESIMLRFNSVLSTEDKMIYSAIIFFHGIQQEIIDTEEAKRLYNFFEVYYHPIAVKKEEKKQQKKNWCTTSDALK